MKKLGLCSLFLCLSLCMASDQSPEASLGCISQLKLWLSTNPTVLSFLSSRPMTWLQNMKEKEIQEKGMSSIFTIKNQRVVDEFMIGLVQDIQEKSEMKRSPLSLTIGELDKSHAGIIMTNVANHIVINTNFWDLLSQGYENSAESPVMKFALAHEIAHSKYNADSTRYVAQAGIMALGVCSGYKVSSLRPLHKGYFVGRVGLGLLCGTIIGRMVGYLVNESVADAHAIKIIAQDKSMSVSERERLIKEMYKNKRPWGYFTEKEFEYELARCQKTKKD